MKKMQKSTILNRLDFSIFNPVSSGRIKKPALLLLLLVPTLAFSGCISRSTYNRDMAKLLNKIAVGQQEYEKMANNLEAGGRDRAETLNKLTLRYMKLQKNHSKLLRRYNNFDNDLNEFAHDLSELKLVVNKNIDKIISSMANEMLIKIIDMEFRVNELRKKDAEELPPLPTGENNKQTLPAAQPAK